METTESVEIWVQTGIPDNGEAIFNVHIRSGQGYEWEVSHPLSQFAAFDQLLNSLVTSLKDVAFPALSLKAVAGIALGKTKEFGKDIEKCRLLLEKWVYLVVSRMQLYPIEVEDIVEDFFLLPCGPIDENELIREPHFDNNNGSDTGSNKFEDSADGSDSVFSGETVSEGGTKRPKRKRILKGIKRRFEKLTSKPAPESTGATTRIVKESERVIDQIQMGKLVKVRVIRGAGTGVNVEYEVQLVHTPSVAPYHCMRMYPAFKALHDTLASASSSYAAAVISSAFPEPKTRGLGFQSDLTELELSERTRMLDAWLRDVCSSYGSLRDRERQAVREFLKLDMSEPVCIDIQDRMVRGLIEANRGVGGANINPSAFLGQQVEDIMQETSSEAAAIAASKADTGSAGSGKTPPTRRGSVRVSEGTVSSPENQFLKTRSASVRVPEQERLDIIKGSLLSNKINTETNLPNRAIRRASSYQVGSTSGLEGSLASPPTATAASGNVTSHRKKRSYVVTVPDSNLHIMMPKRELSTINDEDADVLTTGSKGTRAQEVDKLPTLGAGEDSMRLRSDSSSSNLEEKLLHIGSKKTSSSAPKQQGCCCIS